MTSDAKPEKPRMAARKRLAPATRAKSQPKKSPEDPTIAALRRRYAEADDRRRAREAEFSDELTKVRAESELECDIADFRSWREALFVCESFQAAVAAIPARGRLDKAMALIGHLRRIWAVVLLLKSADDEKRQPTPMSGALNPKDVAADLRNPSVSSLLAQAARLVTNEEARALQEIAARYPALTTFNPDNLGRRGGTALPAGAWRGWMVREVSDHVPQGTKNRYSVIAWLLRCAGLEVSRQDVYSILLKGRT